MAEDRQHEAGRSLIIADGVLYGADRQVACWLARRVASYSPTPTVRASRPLTNRRRSSVWRWGCLHSYEIPAPCTEAQPPQSTVRIRSAGKLGEFGSPLRVCDGLVVVPSPVLAPSPTLRIALLYGPPNCRGHACRLVRR